MTFEQSFRTERWDRGAEKRVKTEPSQGGVLRRSRLQRVPALLLLRHLISPPLPCSRCLCTSPLQGTINLGTSENKLCFDLLSWRVSPGAPLGDITSSRGLSSLGLPGMLPPQEPLACLSSPGLGVRSPGSRSAFGATFYVVLGWSLPYPDPVSSFLQALPFTQSLQPAGSLLSGETLSGVRSVSNNWLGVQHWFVAFASSRSVNIPSVNGQYGHFQATNVTSLHAELGGEARLHT